ncbi:unnamed protein product [Calypogeia fissa]
MTPTTSSTKRRSRNGVSLILGVVGIHSVSQTGGEGSEEEDERGIQIRGKRVAKRSNFAGKFAVAFAAPGPSPSGPGTDGRSRRGACTLSAELLMRSSATYSKGKHGIAKMEYGNQVFKI